MDINTPLRTRIRISDDNGWAAGIECIYLGYNAQYDSVKVGFVDADGNYTGDHTRVPRSAASVVDTAPASAPSGNVTITLPAEYAARVVADLKALRAANPDLSTPALHVVKVRLEAALSDAAPAPAPAGGGALTGDVLDPCETQDAPAPMATVTRVDDLVDDLDPAARYALWVCNAEMRRPGVLHNKSKCYGHSVHVAGTGAEIAGPMGVYQHAYAERLND